MPDNSVGSTKRELVVEERNKPAMVWLEWDLYIPTILCRIVYPVTLAHTLSQEMDSGDTVDPYRERKTGYKSSKWACVV